MPKQYTFNPEKQKKTKVGDTVGNHGIMGGNGGVVTWSLSESDVKQTIKEHINPLEGILDVNLEDLRRYDDSKLLELILHLEERRHFGYLKDTSFKQRQFRDICEFLREIRNGTEETKRD
jgi:hypothetical protein